MEMPDSDLLMLLGSLNVDLGNENWFPNGINRIVTRTFIMINRMAVSNSCQERLILVNC
jgi:hypothetical protein